MFGGNFAVGVVFFVPGPIMVGWFGFSVGFVCRLAWVGVCSYWLLLGALILAVVVVLGLFGTSGGVVVF